MKTEKCDVLVIGSGGAGLRAAIELKDRDTDVLVVGKCKKNDAHTILATGGINAALGTMDPGDSWELHAADTIRDGGGINDIGAVMTLCKNAPYAVKELARWGTKFHRENNGRITQRFFGAASFRRACFVGDHTGREILNTLVRQTLKRKIRFRSEVYIFSLLKSNGAINGALGLDVRKGKIIAFNAKAIILATGGHSRMFARSSSRFWENNGDGIFLAKQAGAKFMDMEMFQFHPTGMVYPKKAEGVLVTEAVRGEGGTLTNAKGERFMHRYDAERMELSARDVVARAIYTEVAEGRGTKHGGVWLDISHRPKEYILKRLPFMYKQFKRYAGIDITKQKMEVAPTAHYSMGGIYVDHATGSTGVPGLYAIGEVTAGLHGGNRLGGNSLAEIIVFGRLTGKQVAKDAKKRKAVSLDMHEVKKEAGILESMLGNDGRNPVEVKKNMQQIMWKHAGVVRNGKAMKKALKELDKFRKMELNAGKGMKMNEKLIAALDVRNAIPACEMILKSALLRKESRAAHYRSDCKKAISIWKKNIICEWKGGKLMPKPKAAGKTPPEIAKLLKHERKAHLLE